MSDRTFFLVMAISILPGFCLLSSFMTEPGWGVLFTGPLVLLIALGGSFWVYRELRGASRALRITIPSVIVIYTVSGCALAWWRWY